MDIIVIRYNPQVLAYEVGFKDFPVVDLRSYRMDLIAEINTIQLALCGEPLSDKEFDRHMRSTTHHLEMIINDQSAVLNRKRYDDDHN